MTFRGGFDPFGTDRYPRIVISTWMRATAISHPNWIPMETGSTLMKPTAGAGLLLYRLTGNPIRPAVGTGHQPAGHGSPMSPGAGSPITTGAGHIVQVTAGPGPLVPHGAPRGSTGPTGRVMWVGAPLDTIPHGGSAPAGAGEASTMEVADIITRIIRGMGTIRVTGRAEGPTPAATVASAMSESVPGELDPPLILSLTWKAEPVPILSGVADGLQFLKAISAVEVSAGLFVPPEIFSEVETAVIFRRVSARNLS